MRWSASAPAAGAQRRPPVSRAGDTAAGACQQVGAVGDDRVDHRIVQALRRRMPRPAGVVGAQHPAALGAGEHGDRRPSRRGRRPASRSTRPGDQPLSTDPDQMPSCSVAASTTSPSATRRNTVPRGPATAGSTRRRRCTAMPVSVPATTVPPHPSTATASDAVGAEPVPRHAVVPIAAPGAARRGEQRAVGARRERIDVRPRELDRHDHPHGVDAGTGDAAPARPGEQRSARRLVQGEEARRPPALDWGRGRLSLDDRRLDHAITSPRLAVTTCLFSMLNSRPVGGPR